MIASTLLAGYDKWRKMGLICNRCPAQLRKGRGCLSKPVNLDTGQVWDADSWAQNRRSIGWSSDQISAHSEDTYAYANKGDVWGRLGWLWPACPRSFTQFGSQHARIRANHVLAIARATKQGDPTRVRTGPLTPAGAHLVEQTLSLWENLQDELEAEAMEKARNKGGGKNE